MNNRIRPDKVPPHVKAQNQKILKDIIEGNKTRAQERERMDEIKSEVIAKDAMRFMQRRGQQDPRSADKATKEVLDYYK